MSNEEGSVLGKRIEFPKAYSPGILVAVPRHLNREKYGITSPGELFCGYDSWHAYEASFILSNGLPVAGVLKIVYPADSLYIVESKSLKLYLGSFSMSPLGNNRTEAIGLFCSMVEEDLSRVLQAHVRVHFFGEAQQHAPFDFEDYKVLEEHTLPDIRISHYQEYPAYLEENISTGNDSVKWCSHLLKSNCKITDQPDWGSVYIHMQADRLPAPESVLKYIVSLRNENHFHEEICEMIFKRLTDIFHPQALMVCCLYTRRGGIDICPARASSPVFLPCALGKPGILTGRTFRQ